jgi:hypothetical protein
MGRRKSSIRLKKRTLALQVGESQPRKRSLSLKMRIGMMILMALKDLISSI